MSKETVKRITLFDSTDLTAAEEYFSDMARSGWMLKKHGFVSEFTRCEPQKLRFSVQILYPKRGTNYEKAVKEYTELCEQAGWRSVSSYSGMHVFVTEKSDIPEIVTDPKERIEAVSRQSRIGIILLWLVPLLFIGGTAQFIKSLSEGKSFPSLLALEFPMTLCFVSLLAAAVIKTASYLKWRNEAVRSAASDMPIRYYDLREAGLRKTFLCICLAMIMAAGIISLIGCFV